MDNQRLFALITEIMLKDLPKEGPGSEYELIMRRKWDEIRRLFILHGIDVSTD